MLPIFGESTNQLKIIGANSSISLGTHFDKFINQYITDGRFNNAGEVIKAGLGLLEEEENKAKALRNTIHEGLNSGRANNLNAKKH